MAVERLRLVARRPQIPPLLWIALGLWLIIALAFPLVREVDQTTLRVLFWAGATGALGGAGTLLANLVSGRRRSSIRRILLIGVMTFSLSVVGVSGRALSMDDATASLTPHARQWTFVLTRDAKSDVHGLSATALATDGTHLPMTVDVMLEGDPHELLIGTRLSARTVVKAPPERERAYDWQNGIVGEASLSSYEVAPLGGPLGALFAARAESIGRIRDEGGGSGPLMEALACGYRRDLDDGELYGDFQRSGLAHLVAVSGAHLTLVSMVVLALLRALGTPRAAQIVAISLLSLVYWLLCGLAISALRAAIMMITALGSYGAHRRAFPLNGLALCILGFLIIDPTVALAVSFGLSAGSTLGIIVFTPLMLGWFIDVRRGVRDAVVEPLALTLSSAMITQPASAAIFAQIPLISPIANVIVGPFFTAACLGSLLAALLAVGCPALAPVVIGAAALVATPLRLLVGGLGSLPWAALPCDLSLPFAIAISIVCALGLWLWWPIRARSTIAAGAVAAAIVIGTALWMTGHPLHDEIIMLDVGQGDAFVLRSQGATIMIDTGRRDGDLKTALARHGITHLDALCITHGDEDHCGSMEALAMVCAVDRVIVSAPTLDCPCDSCRGLLADAERIAPGRVCGLDVGTCLTVGRFRLEIIGPDEFVDDGGNADSLTMVARADEDGDGTVDWSALFCGDAEEEAMEKLVRAGRLDAVDILKVAHHGSRAAVSETLLATLKPSIALISVGADNRYGHPTEETLTLLEQARVKTWRSDQAGDVTLDLRANGLTVTSEHAGSG